MKVGSLFAGIGGFDLGLERAGMEIAWQVEIDPFCQRVLKKHWPNVRRHDDIRTFEGWPADLICGGFPCQDVSFAGKGEGLEGERSGLWWSMRDVIRKVRPRWVVVENVAALLGRGIDAVLGSLAAIGFDCEWDCIPASAIGAPHQRDRVWIIGHADRHCEPAGAIDATAPELPETMANADRIQLKVGDDEARVADQTSGEAGPQVEGRERMLGNGGAQVSDADGKGLKVGQSKPSHHGQKQPAIERSDWWLTEPDVGRVAHGIPARMDRLRGLGNAIVPQIAEWIGRRILNVRDE